MEAPAKSEQPGESDVRGRDLAGSADRPRRFADLYGWPIVTALLARLGLVMIVLSRHPGREPARLFWTADTQHYLDLAASLLQGRFATAAGHETYRLPGYPLFLTPGVALGFPTIYALIAQSLLCCVLVVLVVGTARRAGLGRRASIASGVLCALEPTLLLWSVLLMADTLLGVMVGATLLALIAHLSDGSKKTLALSTGAAAASALVKPVAYGLIVVVGLVASLAGRARGVGGALRLFLGVALCGVLILGGWQARSGSASGPFGFSSQFSHVMRSADFEIWRSEHPSASGEAVRDEWRRLGLDKPPGMGPPPRFDGALLKRLEFHLRGVWRVLSNPGVLTWFQLLDLEPRGMAASWELLVNGPWGFLTQSVSRRPWVVGGSVLLGLVNLAYWGLFAVGLRGLMPRKRKAALAAGLLIAYFSIASGGPWGQSRFRIPFVSALCLVAAATFDRRLGFLRDSRRLKSAP